MDSRPVHFVRCFSALIVSSAFVFSLFPKGVLELKINGSNSPFFDFFFSGITHFGHGIWIFFLLVALLFYRYYYAVLLAASSVLMMFVVTICKHVIFKGEPRPAIFFKDEAIHFVSGVQIAHLNTFPSGHTATVFVAISVLAFVFNRNRIVQLNLLVFGSLVGFSRIYLMQHFSWDVWAGAIVGVFSVTFSKYLMDKKLEKDGINESIQSSIKVRPRIGKIALKWARSYSSKS